MPGAGGDVFMVDGSAEVRGVEVGCCVDEADVVEGGVEVGDEEGVVAVGKSREKVDARFFKHFALEGLENGLAVIGSAARKVPAAGIRTSGLFHKEDAVGPLDEGIDAKVGLRCHFEISIPGDVF